MAIREDIRFSFDGGVKLGAWLYLPDSSHSRSPAITMAHGYAGTREHGIAKFAEAFAAAGFIVLLHDHRTFGVSDGEPRQDVDPWCQIADWRRALSYRRAEVDASRIGIWGTSYAGGNALVLGATDSACVVAQVPTISGYQQGSRRVAPEGVAALEAVLDDDERAQARGEAPRLQAVVNRMYEPGVWAPRIGPKPLMIIVAAQDTLTLIDLALEDYERAHQPKERVMIPGGHFDPYLSGFEASCDAALQWFQEHLGR
jgi:uncharacterized protein